MSNWPRIPSTLAETIEPAETALVVWDMQHGMAGRAFNLPQVTEQVRRLLDAADRAGATVIWSRHTGLPLEFTPAVRLADFMERQKVGSPAELKPHMEAGTAEWQFLPGFEPGLEHLVLEKGTPSFFIGTPLESVLRARGIRTLVLCGVATERGIEMTARHAVALGFFVVVAEDAVGSFTEAGHELGLRYLRSAMPVPPTDEIVAAWGGAGG